MKSLIIRGGTVVNADMTFRADILCESGVVAAVGLDLEVPQGSEVIDAGGCYVMPGGIDPHTHMQLPFMGTVSSESFLSGSRAGLAGGTTMILDFVIPEPGERPLEAYAKWRNWALPAALDYSFHVAVTWWSPEVRDDLTELSCRHGVNSFKHFMAYKGSLMASDEILLQSFSHARDLGALCTVHAENGEMVAYLQRQLLRAGISGPAGHPVSRPPMVEAEAANRAMAIARAVGAPLYIVHTSCAEAVEQISRARRAGQRVYAEVLAGHLIVDDTVYASEDWQRAAAHVMSPPFRSADNQAALWRALRAGDLQTTATDHCCFCSAQKAMGRDDFTKIPNGTPGIQDRLHVLWHFGVSTGRLTLNEFVAVTSTNAARIFNIYPRKGIVRVGSDADLLVWDPRAARTISARTHLQAIDFNLFEGVTVQGVNTVTIANGHIAYRDGQVLSEPGSGRYIERPPFGGIH